MNIRNYIFAFIDSAKAVLSDQVAEFEVPDTLWIVEQRIQSTPGAFIEDMPHQYTILPSQEASQRPQASLRENYRGYPESPWEGPSEELLAARQQFYNLVHDVVIMRLRENHPEVPVFNNMELNASHLRLAQIAEDLHAATLERINKPQISLGHYWAQTRITEAEDFWARLRSGTTPGGRLQRVPSEEHAERCWCRSMLSRIFPEFIVKYNYGSNDFKDAVARLRCRMKKYQILAWVSETGEPDPLSDPNTKYREESVVGEEDTAWMDSLAKVKYGEVSHTPKLVHHNKQKLDIAVHCKVIDNWLKAPRTKCDPAHPRQFPDGAIDGRGWIHHLSGKVHGSYVLSDPYPCPLGCNDPDPTESNSEGSSHEEETAPNPQLERIGDWNKLPTPPRSPEQKAPEEEPIIQEPIEVTALKQIFCDTLNAYLTAKSTGITQALSYKTLAVHFPDFPEHHIPETGVRLSSETRNVSAQYTLSRLPPLHSEDEDPTLRPHDADSPTTGFKIPTLSSHPMLDFAAYLTSTTSIELGTTWFHDIFENLYIMKHDAAQEDLLTRIFVVEKEIRQDEIRNWVRAHPDSPHQYEENERLVSGTPDHCPSMDPTMFRKEWGESRNALHYLQKVRPGEDNTSVRAICIEDTPDTEWDLYNESAETEGSRRFNRMDDGWIADLRGWMVGGLEGNEMMREGDAAGGFLADDGMVVCERYAGKRHPVFMEFGGRKLRWDCDGCLREGY